MEIKIKLLLGIILLLCSCKLQENTKSQEGILSTYYIKYDKLDGAGYNLRDAIELQRDAYAKGDKEQIEIATDEIAKKHEQLLQSVRKEFPNSSISIPFLQKGNSNDCAIKNIVITNFFYPWSTAPRMAFNMRINYDVLNLEYRYKTMRLEWYDIDNDIIMGMHLDINKTGYTDFVINPEVEFRKLKNVVIL